MRAVADLRGMPGGPLSRVDIECPEHGAVTGLSLGGRPAVCPECARNHVARHGEQGVIAARDPQLRAVSKIPLDMRESTFSNYDTDLPGQRLARDAMRSYTSEWPARLASGSGVLMCGTSGTGKTHLAVALMQNVIERHKNVAIYATAHEVVADVRRQRGDSGEYLSESAQYEKWARPDLLVLDELERLQRVQFDRNVIFHVINQRMSKRRPTVVISNLSLPDLQEAFGRGTVERIIHKSLVITFDFPTHRKAAQVVSAR